MVEIIQALTALAWPVLVGALLWVLYPTIRQLIQSRGFTVRVGGAEITVQQASEQLGNGVQDVREQLAELKRRLDGVAPDGANGNGSGTPTDGAPKLRRVLWVDDHPENNAFEVAALRRLGIDVVEVFSTSEAVRATCGAASDFDVIVTDMGREEAGRFVPDAGLELIRAIRDQHVQQPVIAYTSAPTLARTRDRFLEAGGTAATASGTELMDLLGRLGIEQRAPAA